MEFVLDWYRRMEYSELWDQLFECIHMRKIPLPEKVK